MEENTQVNQKADELELLTLPEVAQILKVSLSTLRRYKNRKENPLPVIHLSSQEVRVRRIDLLTWAQALPDPRQNI
jgi:predicted DNA-binding transcriptional regulator AlpA